MITIYCALYAEGQYLIQNYELKKEPECKHFQVFSNEEQNIRLVITGVGRTSAAVAVAEISTIYPPDACDCMVNLGSCAGGEDVPAGSVIMANSLMDVESGRTFYPDMIYKHPFLEGRVETSARIHEASSKQNRVDGNTDAKQIVVHDMEATGLYEAGNYYYGPHQMVFMKVVTDHGIAGPIDRDSYREAFAGLMQDGIGKVIGFLDGVRELLRKQDESRLMQPDTADIHSLAEDLCCSVTMRAELEQLLTYWRLAHYDVKPMIDVYYEQGLLPCKDKREGRRLLNELQRKWL